MLASKLPCSTYDDMYDKGFMLASRLSCNCSTYDKMYFDKSFRLTSKLPDKM